jgi:hypothetical protein
MRINPQSREESDIKASSSSETLDFLPPPLPPLPRLHPPWRRIGLARGSLQDFEATRRPRSSSTLELHLARTPPLLHLACQIPRHLTSNALSARRSPTASLRALVELTNAMVSSPTTPTSSLPRPRPDTVVFMLDPACFLCSFMDPVI